MKLYLVAIRDNAIEVYHNLTTVRAKGEAIRNFQDALTDANNKSIAKHPGDFDLYAIGEYDDNTAHIDTTNYPERLARGADYAAIFERDDRLPKKGN